jgi:hypothetical protein
MCQNAGVDIRCSDCGFLLFFLKMARMNNQQKERMLLYVITTLVGVLFSIVIWQAQRVIDQVDRTNDNLIRLEGRFIQFENDFDREQDQVIRRLENLESKGK